MFHEMRAMYFVNGIVIPRPWLPHIVDDIHALHRVLIDAREALALVLSTADVQFHHV